jgi:hypothetical protein
MRTRRAAIQEIRRYLHASYDPTVYPFADRLDAAGMWLALHHPSDGRATPRSRLAKVPSDGGLTIPTSPPAPDRTAQGARGSKPTCANPAGVSRR